MEDKEVGTTVEEGFTKAVGYIVRLRYNELNVTN